MRKLNTLSLGLSLWLGMIMATGSALAAGAGGKITEHDWSFSGPFGYYDQASLQRGFKVYREVCSGCHGLEFISFRNFAELGSV